MERIFNYILNLKRILVIFFKLKDFLAIFNLFWTKKVSYLSLNRILFNQFQSISIKTENGTAVANSTKLNLTE